MPLLQSIAPSFDPRTWPWIFDVWIVIILLGFLKPLWQRIQRHRISNWPVTMGQINSTFAGKPKPTMVFFTSGSRGPQYVAQLDYSYSVAGITSTGTYKRPLATEDAAAEFIRGLAGKAVSVHYNPNKPSASGLSEESIQILLGTRPPQPLDSERPEPDVIPALMKPFIWVFIALSAVGFVLSLWVHIGALSGIRVAPGWFFVLLHAGIFVVWAPAVFVASKRNRRGVNPKDYWKVLLRGAPAWMTYMIYGLFAYAFINFALFMLRTQHPSSGSNPGLSEWRGFSGHWMLFYGAAFAILYSAAKLQGSGPRCVNGHPMPPNSNFCPLCGQPLNSSIIKNPSESIGD
jgi:hypothetical protein